MVTSACSPPTTLPGFLVKVSQIEVPRPSAVTAPSIW
jgi:hypothetical protein